MIVRRRMRSFSSPACYLDEFQKPATASRRRDLQIKRIYDAPEAGDGFRVLVDRLWPRGISKRRAALDAWLAELAPSTALRQWFHKDASRWAEFARRYRAELRAHATLLRQLRQRASRQRVTLLYAARDERRNHAIILRAVLARAARSGRGPVRASPRRVS